MINCLNNGTKIKCLRIILIAIPFLLLLSYYVILITLFNVFNIAKNSTFETTKSSNIKINKTWNISYDYSQYLNNSCGLPYFKPNLQNRIINGYDARPHSFPWMVSIGFTGPQFSFSHICGGSLLNERFILTAAHCVYSKTIFDIFDLTSSSNLTIESMGRVRLGIQEINNNVPNNSVYLIKQIIIHPNYVDTSFNFENDIALVELTTNVTFNENISYICLNRNFSLELSQPVYIIGWGQKKTSIQKYENNLLQAEIYILNFDLCAINWNANPDSQICAGTVGYSLLADTCIGDSGGPLMIKSTDNSNRWFIVGIASVSNNLCDGLSLYTNINYFYNWIIQNIS